LRLPTPDKVIGLVLLSLGAAGIVLSIFYESTVVAFIGLTLAFWGCLFLLVLPRKVVGSDVLDNMNVSSLSSIDMMISNLNVQGRAVYIPVPRESYLPYHIGFKQEFLYIPEREVTNETALEQALTRNPKGLRLIPPGLGLANLIEKKSGLKSHDLDLSSLAEVLPSVITDDLEVASGFRIAFEGNEVHTGTKGSVCEELCREASKMQHICPGIGCPLCSSICCLLTRATNRPVTIDRCSITHSNIETWYRIL